MTEKYETWEEWVQKVLGWIDDELSSSTPSPSPSSYRDVQRISAQDLQDVSPAGSRQVPSGKIQRFSVESPKVREMNTY